MLGEEVEDAAVVPALPALCGVWEADVAAEAGGFHVEERVWGGDGIGEGRGGEERVVEGVEEEGGDGEVGEEREGGGALPVVFGAGEAVEWSGDAVVEVVDGADGAEVGGVERAGELAGFGEGFGDEGPEETEEVETIAGLVEGLGAGGEVDGCGDGDGGGDGGVGRGFGGVFEGEIAAEAEADEGDGGGSWGGVGDDEAEVVGGTAVVGLGETVGDAAAGAVVPCEDVPAGAVEGAGETADVGGVEAAFETVGEDGERGRLRGWAEHPCEVEEVRVGEFEPFERGPLIWTGWEEAGEDGGGVAVSEETRREVG